MSQYGQSGLELDGHSRGSMTIGNALESQMTNPNSVGSLSDTTIHFFGPAYNVQKADNLLGFLQNRESVTDTKQFNDMILLYQNHLADPVGGLIGKNQSTGGTIPDSSSVFGEAVRAAAGKPVTVHNCYGNSSESTCAEYWQDTGGYPNFKKVLK
jgi:filamentous hemagglutinin